jgi:hypothetical protein
MTISTETPTQPIEEFFSIKKACFKKQDADVQLLTKVHIFFDTIQLKGLLVAIELRKNQF